MPGHIISKYRMNKNFEIKILNDEKLILIQSFEKKIHSFLRHRHV